jgi:hypothetical protein
MWQDRKFEVVNLKSYTSVIKIDEKKEYIIKIQNRHLDYDCHKREIHVLKLLEENGCEWAPKLVSHDEKKIVMNYCGEQVDQRNIPSDYHEQMGTILTDLENIGVKHNDIKMEEVLVKNGRLHLCDFGWSSVNGDFSCGIGIDGRKKIDGIFEDSDIIPQLDSLYQFKRKMIPVSRRRNGVGSQSENPILNVTKDYINVGGYQSFRIKRDSIVYISKIGKYNLLRDTLKKLKGENCNSVTDIGCSSGIVSYTSNLLGYETIRSLDHDLEYISLMNKINDKLNIENVKPSRYSFGDKMEKTDVVVMCALIHWIYSCTALYGDFDSIFKYLKCYTSKYLLIEWVDPRDPAIGDLHHLDHNKAIHKEEYNIVNFEKSLNKNIGEFISKDKISPHRILYTVRCADK